jgi:hypothetical protein
MQHFRLVGWYLGDCARRFGGSEIPVSLGISVPPGDRGDQGRVSMITYSDVRFAKVLGVMCH